jgi:NADPH-dependent F420 reductase
LAQDKILRLAILGGTGKEGMGLALRWAHAGYEIMIGSREQARAQQTAQQINEQLDDDGIVHGLSNAEAARLCDIAILCVPYAAHRDTLESVKDALKGKILIDVTAPLDPDDYRKASFPSGKSAGEEAQQLLGDEVKVVSAFQNISFTSLKKLDKAFHTDVLVTGNDADAKQQVIALAEAIGLRAFDAGPIQNAIAAEALTAALVNINIQHKVLSSGIQITGIRRS